MSHSVPSDSSVTDSTFLIGTDLVTFDRHDLPIYATPRSLWAEAGNDIKLHGLSVDRLYGEPGETFVASLPLIEEPRELAPSLDDPLVALPGLGDGLILSICEHQQALDLPTHAVHAPGVATVYDFAGDSHFLTPAHDGLNWDLAKPEWFYDHHI